MKSAQPATQQNCFSTIKFLLLQFADQNSIEHITVLTIDFKMMSNCSDEKFM